MISHPPTQQQRDRAYFETIVRIADRHLVGAPRRPAPNDNDAD